MLLMVGISRITNKCGNGVSGWCCGSPVSTQLEFHWGSYDIAPQWIL